MFYLNIRNNNLSKYAAISFFINIRYFYSETEDDSSTSQSKTRPKLGSGSRASRHHSRYQQTSHSLPATPRVNGNTVFSSLNTNSNINLPPQHTSTPFALAPHLAWETSLNSTGGSQYITCSSGVLGDSKNEDSGGVSLHCSKFSGSRHIDYSSLPLPHDDPSNKLGYKKNISRHLSEPCIPHSGSRSSKYLSCPSRKISNKYKTKDCEHTKENGFLDGITEDKNDNPENDGSDAMEVQWRFIQTLVEELNLCRRNNNKLVAELHQARLELQILRSTLDSYNEAGLVPGAITGENFIIFTYKSFLEVIFKPSFENNPRSGLVVVL